MHSPHTLAELLRRFDQTRLGRASAKWAPVYDRADRLRRQLKRAEAQERKRYAEVMAASAEDTEGMALRDAIDAEHERRIGVPF